MFTFYVCKNTTFSEKKSKLHFFLKSIATKLQKFNLYPRISTPTFFDLLFFLVFLSFDLENNENEE